MYRLLFRLLLSRLDPERAHTFAFRVFEHRVGECTGKMIESKL
jgi:hypothetical protein